MGEVETNMEEQMDSVHISTLVFKLVLYVNFKKITKNYENLFQPLKHKSKMSLKKTVDMHFCNK